MNNDTKELKERLNVAWKADRRHEVCGILIDEVWPRVFQWLTVRFEKLSEEDYEDCFDAATTNLLDRSRGDVDNVYGYVFQSAYRNAIDIINERKLLFYYDSERNERDDVSGWDYLHGDDDFTYEPVPSRLIVVAEAALDEELAIRDEHLKRLFQLTLRKLIPRRRRMAELLLTYRSDIGNRKLAEMMSTSESALKSLKSRTLEDLRRLLPVAADELGIDLERALNPPPEVMTSTRAIPSDVRVDLGVEADPRSV